MKYIWWTVGAVAIIGALVLVVVMRPMTATTSMDTVEKSDTSMEADVSAVNEPNTDVSEPTAVSASGRYKDYSSELVDDAGFQTTILFFYAGWCPECRGYDMAINDSIVPAGTQILKLNYDDVQDLRQEYGVTIQSTFVRVNAAGVKQTLWNGYGREKSLSAILENTK